MVKEKYERVDEIVKEELNQGTFPGAVVLVQDQNEVLFHRSYGSRAEVPEEETMETDTIFDLASLTKVVATTTLAIKLVEDGIWKLRDPLSRYVAEFDHSEVTLLNLLTHTSGLVPWVDLFSGKRGREDSLKKLFTDKWPVLNPVVPPGERVIYSDLNFILLGIALKRITGTDLDDLARNEIFEPLNMDNSSFNPPDRLNERIAPTEKSSRRNTILRGEVHDENCYALGGVSGHAGLFSTAGDLANFLSVLLNGGEFNGKRFISAGSVRLFNRNFTSKLNENRGLGWKLQGEETESAGDLLSKTSFGHTGFTGGSIWVDPQENLGIILLTNRVHPERSRGQDRINDFRARVNNVILGELT